jgi:hypothetical protein
MRPGEEVVASLGEGRILVVPKAVDKKEPKVEEKTESLGMVDIVDWLEEGLGCPVEGHARYL